MVHTQALLYSINNFAPAVVSNRPHVGWGKVLSNSELLGQSCFTYGMGLGELKDPWKVVLCCTRFVLPRRVYGSHDRSLLGRIDSRWVRGSNSNSTITKSKPPDTTNHNNGRSAKDIGDISRCRTREKGREELTAVIWSSLL